MAKQKITPEELSKKVVEEKIVVKYVKQKTTKILRKIFTLNLLLLILFILNSAATAWAGYTLYKQLRYNYEHPKTINKEEKMSYLP